VSKTINLTSFNQTFLIQEKKSQNNNWWRNWKTTIPIDDD